MSTTKNLKFSSGEPAILSKKTLLASKLFTIKQLKIKMPKGAVRIHDIVERGPTVSVFPLTEKNELYLVEQYRYLHKKQTLEAMAGFVDVGEKPLSAAKRELKEETGLKANKWSVISQFEVAASVLKATNYLFLAKDLEKGMPCPEEDEEIKLVKIPLKEAVKKVMTGEINHGASMIGILLISRLKSTIYI